MAVLDLDFGLFIILQMVRNWMVKSWQLGFDNSVRCCCSVACLHSVYFVVEYVLHVVMVMDSFKFQL